MKEVPLNKAKTAGGADPTNFEGLEDRLFLSAPVLVDSSASLSGSRYQIAAVTVDSKAFFVGGIGGAHPILEPDDFVDVYDASLGQWSAMKMPIAGVGTAFAVQGDVLFIGAQNVGTGNPITHSTEVFHSRTGRWTVAAAPNLAGGLPTQAGRFVIYTGTDRTVQLYDTRSNRWSRARIQYSIGPFGTVVGETAYFSTGAAHDVVEAFDGRTGRWSVVHVPGAESSQLSGFGDKLVVEHIAGGPTASKGYIDTVSFYDPVSRSVLHGGVPSQPHNPTYPGATVAAVGTKAIFIGSNIASTLQANNTLDIFDGVSGKWSTTIIPPTNNPNDALITFLQVGNKLIFTPPGFGADKSGLVYDAGTDVWSMVTFAIARDSMGMTTVGTQAIFAGGRAAAPDVGSFRPVNTVDIFTDTAPSTVLSGGLTGNIGHRDQVTIINTGDADLARPYGIQLYASLDRTLNGAILVGTRGVTTPLPAGASATFGVRTILPKDTPAGTYHLLAAISDGAGHLTPIAAEDATFRVGGKQVAKPAGIRPAKSMAGAFTRAAHSARQWT